jgi:hypothetical protein
MTYKKERKCVYLVSTIAGLIFVTAIALSVFRRNLLDYVAFQCGSDWAPITNVIPLALAFRAALGLIGVIALGFGIAALRMSRRAAAAVHISVSILALFISILGSGWNIPLEAYLNGLASVVSKNEFRQSLGQLEEEVSTYPGGSEQQVSLPGPLGTLRPELFSGAVIGKSGLRAVWGRRGIGGWGLYVGSNPIGKNMQIKLIRGQVYVFCTPPF